MLQSVKMKMVFGWLNMIHGKTLLEKIRTYFRTQVAQVFFVDNPHDVAWKVVEEKSPRSKRCAQEDDDELRSDAAEHVFNAPSLATFITEGLTGLRPTPSTRMSTQPETATFDTRAENQPFIGQSISEGEVQVATRNREADDNPIVYLHEDYEDKDDNLPLRDDSADGTNQAEDFRP